MAKIFPVSYIRSLARQIGYISIVFSSIAMAFSAADDQASDASEPSGRGGKELQPNTPMLDAIELCYATRKIHVVDPRDGKRIAQINSDVLGSLVDDQLTKAESRGDLLRELVLVDTYFSKAVLDHTVVSLAAGNAREDLVWLLAHRCPSTMFLHLPVEYFLAGSEKLTDGVLVLCDAFEKSSNVRNRSRIAIALRRGFTAVGVREKDDAVFVAAVRTWYLRNRDDVELNRAEYCSRLIHSPLKKDGTFFDDDEPSPYGLFVPKKDPPAQQPNKR